MIVKELIDELNKLPPNYEVLLEDYQLRLSKLYVIDNVYIKELDRYVIKLYGSRI